MKELLKIEFKRAFTGFGMRLSLFIGALLAIEHFVFRVIPVTEFLFFGFSEYAAGSLMHNLTTEWMYGSITMESNIYKSIVYILIVLPFGASFYGDVKSGIIKNITTRVNKREFLISKSIANFFAAGCAGVFPLLLNLMLTATLLPYINNAQYGHMALDVFFVRIYMYSPILYWFVYFGLIFIFSGLIAGIGLSASLIIENRFLVLTFPYLLFSLLDRTLNRCKIKFFRGFVMQKIFSVFQSSSKNLWGTVTAGIVIFILGYVVFIMVGSKKDIF